MNFKNTKKIFASTIALTLVTAPIMPLAAFADTTASSTQGVKIERLGGTDRFDTAVEISKKGWSSAESVVLASGNDANLVDALTVVPLAKAKSAPILLTGSEQLNLGTKAEIKRLGAKTVFVASGTGVISDNILQGLKDEGITIVRLGATDRYKTSVTIAEELAKIVSFKTAVIANSYANVDALSVAPIAAAKGMPILLTDKDSLPTEVSKLITDKGVTSATVIGGTGVVSDAVKMSLPGAQRIGGNDRFDTNKEVIKAYKNSVKEDTIFIANGYNEHLVDSLAGAALAAQMDSEIVFSEQQAIPAGTLEYINSNQAVNQVYILGGIGAVADSVASGLVNNKKSSIGGSSTGGSSTGGSSTGGSSTGGSSTGGSSTGGSSTHGSSTGGSNSGGSTPVVTTPGVLQIVGTPQANLVLGYLSVTVNDQTKVAKVLVNGAEVSCTPANNVYTVPISDLTDKVVFVGTNGNEVIAQAGTTPVVPTQGVLQIVGTPQANLVLGYLSVTVNDQTKVNKVLVNGAEVTCIPLNNVYTVPINDLTDKVVFVGTDGNEIIAQAGTTPGGNSSGLTVTEAKYDGILGFLKITVNDSSLVKTVILDGTSYTVGGPVVNGVGASLVAGDTIHVKVTNLSAKPSTIVLVSNSGDQVQAP
ncbi:MAG: cell wall-binding repeat-containing protein [Desulfosporosinus sp.]|nr:cell wall-binding repeat-containing protein [Desulfosporosinus sp.]